MEGKKIFNVYLQIFHFKLNRSPYENVGQGQIEILKNENREKILQFTKRNYRKFIFYYLFFSY